MTDSDWLKTDGSTADGTGPAALSDDRLLDLIDTPLYVVNRNGLCQRFNKAAEQLFGYMQSEVLGKNLHDLLHARRPDGSPYPQSECTLLLTIRSGKTVSGIDEVMWSRTGEQLPVRCSVARIVMDGEPGAVITTRDLRPERRAEDILRSVQGETAELLRQRDAASRMERELAAAEAIRQRELASGVERAATEKLREQQDLLEAVVGAAPVGIAVLDRGMRYRWHNRAYGEMRRRTGIPSPASGDSYFAAVPRDEELERIFVEVQRTGKPYVGLAYAETASDGAVSYWNFSVSRLASGDLLLTSMDVTEHTRSQQALVHSDKMAAVGRLAASISHEINNPLEAITNLLYLVQTDPSLSESSREYIATAEAEMARVSRIASQTLRFHRHSLQAVTRTPQQLVEPVLALYEGRLKQTGVRVDLDYDQAGPLTTFEGDVRQILNNLIGNAIDAMRRGGMLRVRTRASHCVKTGRAGTRITIADTGHGMSSETAARIFEPFYTTKGSDGSGLGLWISHTLAERHGGTLQVKSCREGNPHGKPAGTAFSLFLPSEEPAPGTTTQVPTVQ